MGVWLLSVTPEAAFKVSAGLVNPNPRPKTAADTKNKGLLEAAIAMPKAIPTRRIAIAGVYCLPILANPT